MKTSLKIKTVLMAAIVITGFLIATCGEKKAGEHQHAEGESITYACPMHPDITGKQGDICSKCGMELEAVKTDSTKTEHQH